MDLFGSNPGNSCCKRRGRTARGRARRSGAVRGRLIKPKRTSEERGEGTNLFSVSSGEEKRRAPGRKRGFSNGSVSNEDSSGGDKEKKKKRKVRSRCLFSSISDGGSPKREEGKLGERSPPGSRSNCLFSSDVEERSPQGRNPSCVFSHDVEKANRGDRTPHGSIPNCLFSSSSEETPQGGSEEKTKEEVQNGEGAKLQSRMCIREGNFLLSFGETGKTRKKTPSSANVGLQRRAKIANRCGYQASGGGSLRGMRGRRGRRATPYYGLNATKGEGMYRLINFEKLKKRASRKLNFVSIIDMSRGGGDSSVASSVGSPPRSPPHSRGGSSEEDILNRTGVSHVASSESTQESRSDRAARAAVDEERNSNRTIDVYSYYYQGRHEGESAPHRDVEKMGGGGNCPVGEKLYERLFGQAEGKPNWRQEQTLLYGGEATSGGMHTPLQMNRPRNQRVSRNNFMLQRNFQLYRNFKNINVEMSRQNNLKGLNLKEMVVKFIRLVNKNVLAMNERGEMAISQGGDHSGEDSQDTSDVEEWYVTRGDATKGGDTKTQPSLQQTEGEHPQLELAKCACIFCSEKKKILTNGEMHVCTFKYLDERKNEDTVVKPFFMHRYVFTAFINYYIHYGGAACVQGGEKRGEAGGEEGEEEESSERGAIFHWYKFAKHVTKKYGIKGVLLFAAKRVTLTSVGIHVEGANVLQEGEELVVVINFFKWRVMRRRYEEVVKLKRRKRERERESLSFLKTFSFFVKSVDEYCLLCDIRVDDLNGRKNFRQKKRSHTSQPFCKREDNTHRNGCTFFGPSYFSYNEVRVGQIEDALNRELANSRLQFALVDSLSVSTGRAPYLFPAHMLLLV
ncbi:conserved Plasmodium protein, unknown function [Plasmodium vivax]|nr:conserved Plasmodium protein, unknown function [Plasmodium vivax]